VLNDEFRANVVQSETTSTSAQVELEKKLDELEGTMVVEEPKAPHPPNP